MPTKNLGRVPRGVPTSSQALPLTHGVALVRRNEGWHGSTFSIKRGTRETEDSHKRARKRTYRGDRVK